MDATVPRVLLSIALAALLPMASLHSQDGVAKENIPHSRQKRILWITNDGRLALPPGTTMTITPSLSMPFVRHPPKGFLSNMTVSFPFTSKMTYEVEFKIDFDKLGLTDNENPYGAFPPILARSMGRAAVSMMADYVGQYLDRRRGKRSTTETVAPEVEKAILDRMHGGERAILYGMAEDLFANFGLSGKECLLRAICEIQSHPLKNFGFLGEIMKLFFTPSKSPYASLLDEYVQAQKAGEAGGECWPYYRLCPKSIFQSSNKYSKEAEEIHRRQEHVNVEENKIEDVQAM
ncbi:uncharacterized protein LOC113504514 isoform X1 [Trichoplusia ni]|uniref:Uncharacterized protein LOC113504514 isoform X1 n=1 Tax=Trichoplusia ni TaxID=7111 RepID=A0A7E5WR78_TRINI|nr:uncharacterized protein LOC113504514 isoform X1 [Trichoplusia ni]XP_026742661.1 uncharacterized protein LOC113504514 isoform X1 [Trichoplusia ni]